MAAIADLCSRCRTILSDLEALGIWRKVSHHSSLAGLEQSSRQGCPICHWILFDWDRFRKSNREAESSIQSGMAAYTKAQVTEKAGWYAIHTRRPDLSSDAVQDRMLIDFDIVLE